MVAIGNLPQDYGTVYSNDISVVLLVILASQNHGITFYSQKVWNCCFAVKLWLFETFKDTKEYVD